MSISALSQKIDLTTIKCDMPSLCIPRAPTSISKGDIFAIFGELNIGRIAHVDITEKLHNAEKYRAGEAPKYLRIFIYFKEWYTTAHAQQLRTAFLAGENRKIVYADPHFLKVSANRSSAAVAVINAPPPRQALQHQCNRYIIPSKRARESI